VHGLKKGLSGDDLFGWIGLALAVTAMIVLDRDSVPGKWHAAIMWTFCALFGLLIFGRTKRHSWLFRIFWVTCLTLQVFAMWVIFAQLLPRLILGTLYVVPIAIVEALFLLVIFLRVERKLTAVHSHQNSLGSRSEHEK
jgi:hypothetical protein